MKRFITLLLFIISAFVVFIGYYIFHKPFNQVSEVLPMLGALANLILSAAVITLCGALGYRLMSRWRVNGLAGMALQAGLGLGIFSLLWLGLGFLGLYNRWVAYLLLVAGLALLFRDARAWLQQITEWRDIWKAAPLFEKFLLVACAYLVLTQLWIALAPPAHYDALTYHLQLPREYLAQGRLFFDTNNPYWGHTQLSEMLYTWTMALGWEQTASTFGWLVGLLLWFGIAGFTRRYFPFISPVDAQQTAMAACVAPTVLLAGATAREMMGWAYTDLFSGLLGLCLFTCLFEWLIHGSDGWLRWMGAIAGLLVGTKYTSALLPGILFIALWFLPGARRVKFTVWVQAGLIALLLFSPWLIKNLFYTGNPIYPYFIPTQTFPAARLAMADGTPTPVDWRVPLFLPVTYTWMGGESIPGPGTDLGPLLVLFAIAGLIFFRRDKKVLYLALTLLGAWLVIGIGGARYPMLTQPRLFYSLLPALAVPAGWGWVILQDITEYQIRLRRIAGLLILLPLLLAGWGETQRINQTEAVSYLLGQTSAKDYLYKNTGVYILAMNELQELPQDRKVLMLWEGRGFYAPANVTADPWIDRYRFALKQYHTPAAILDSWRAQGFSDIVVDTTHMEPMRQSDTALSKQDWAQFDAMLAGLPSHPMAGGYYVLYHLK